MMRVSRNLALTLVLLLPACGPAALGAAIAGGGGGGGGGGGDGAIQFNESEVNDTPGTANAVGDLFPGRTYNVSAAVNSGAGDSADYFSFNITQNVLVIGTVDPLGNQDPVVEVIDNSGSVIVDTNGNGVNESISGSLPAPQTMFVGVAEFNSLPMSYTIRVEGRNIAPPSAGTEGPYGDLTHTRLLLLNDHGEVLLRVDDTLREVPDERSADRDVDPVHTTRRR